MIYRPPLVDQIKFNTNGVTASISSSYGGIFKNNDAQFLCCFPSDTCFGYAYRAELSSAIRTIKITSQNNWIRNASCFVGA